MFPKSLLKRFTKTNSTYPDYLKVYSWAYINPYLAQLWDHGIFVNILLLNQYQFLKQKYLDEFTSESRVLQMGSTYWDIGPSVAKKVQKYTVVDVLELQVKRLNQKFEDCQIGKDRAYCHLIDASDTNKIQQIVKQEKITTISSFFLFHEIPLPLKQQVLNNMLQFSPAKLVFIDYHLSHNKFLKSFYKIFFHYVEPYAQEFVEKDVWEFGDRELIKGYSWKKEVYFYGVYQKVVADRIQK